MARLDATNLAILNELRDGRRPYSEIARVVGVTENTVRSRVTRLVEQGILEITGTVNPDRVEGLEVIYVGVKLETMDLRGKAEELSRVRGVISSAVVTGRYDVLLTVALAPGLSLLDFYTGAISEVEGISSVETFVVYRGYDVRVPIGAGVL